MQRELIILSIR